MSKFATGLRDLLAAGFRRVPQFRGKAVISQMLQHLLTNYQDQDDCLVTFSMNNRTVMRVDLRSYTERTAFWSGCYDEEELNWITHQLGDRPVILDVGANIGFYSVPLGMAARRLGGRVYSFEPVPSNFERLTWLIEQNQLSDVVTAYRIALGSRDEEITLYLDTVDAETENAVAKPCRLNGRKCAASMTSLDSFVKEHPISACRAIKVDVEGGEFAFLQGARAFIAQHRPLLFVELNHYWMQQFGWSEADLMSELAPYGYRLARKTGKNEIFNVALAAG